MSYNLGRIDPDQRRAPYAHPRSERSAEPHEEEPQERPRRLLAAGAALLVMGLFAGGLWLAYAEGLRHSNGTGSSGDVPLIRADTQPIKVKPANPGGMAIPDRDLLIYGEGRPTVEHLLPPPEQPMARPAPPPPVQAVPSPPPRAASALPVSAVGAAPAETAGNPAGADTATSAAAEIRDRRDRPDQAAAQTAAVPPAYSRRDSREAAAAETAPAKTGGVRLQLGSVRSAGVARTDWDRIKRSNVDLLGHLSAFAVRADLGDKGVYYRIQTGPVADMAHADRICGELRQRHLACMVVR
jgi:SPOR domain